MKLDRARAVRRGTVDPAFPPPTAFGAPRRYTSWRPYQTDALYDAEQSEAPYVAQVLGTGAGKTLIYMTGGVSSGGRMVVLVRTKALQDQIDLDWGPAGLVQIKGANAYPCHALQPGGEFYQLYGRGLKDPTCDDGPCHSGLDCSLKDKGCAYYDQVRAARRAQFVGTNYACWMASNQHAGGFGSFDRMVCDEVHEAPDALSQFLAVRLSSFDLAITGARPLDGTATPDQWKDWAGVHRDRLALVLDNLSGSVKAAEQDEQRTKGAVLRQLAHGKKVLRALDLLAGELDETWVVSRGQDLSFTPVWPAKYAAKALFLGIPKVVLVSATVRRKTAVYLGIPDDQLEMLEYPSAFDPARRPIYYMRNSIRMRAKATEGEQKLWLARIDNIIRARADRKVLIPTVSYQRAQWIYAHSRYRDWMVVHSPFDTRRAIEKFKAARPPCVLLSPAVSTGYDFPFDACEVIIICKVPFPVATDPVLKARELIDPDYGKYVAMQTLVQSAGRGMRAEYDRCEVFIVDGMWGWFKKAYSAFCPQWFLRAVTTIDRIPQLPPKLERGGVRVRDVGRELRRPSDGWGVRPGVGLGRFARGDKSVNVRVRR